MGMGPFFVLGVFDPLLMAKTRIPAGKLKYTHIVIMWAMMWMSSWGGGDDDDDDDDDCYCYYHYYYIRIVIIDQWSLRAHLCW